MTDCNLLMLIKSNNSLLIIEKYLSCQVFVCCKYIDFNELRFIFLICF